MQQPTASGIGPSNSGILVTGPLDNYCSCKSGCSTTIDSMELPIQILASDSQALVHSSQGGVSHMRTPLLGNPSTSLYRLNSTGLSKSISSYVSLPQQSKVRESWLEGRVNSLVKAPESTLSWRARSETMDSLVYTTKSKRETRLYLNDIISSKTNSNATKLIEGIERPCQAMLTFPSPLSDSNSLCSTLSNLATNREFPFTSEIRITGTASPSFSYPSRAHQHQIVSSGTPSLHIASSRTTALRSLAPFSMLIRSSAIPEGKQTRQEAFSNTEGVNTVWQDYQHYFLTASGCLALALILAFVAARYKR